MVKGSAGCLLFVLLQHNLVDRLLPGHDLAEGSAKRELGFILGDSQLGEVFVVPGHVEVEGGKRCHSQEE